MDARVGHIDGRNNHIYYTYKPPMELRDGLIVESTELALPFEVRGYGLPFEREEELVRYLESDVVDRARCQR